MGSAGALRLALDHPDRLRGLALAGPAFGDALNPLADTIAPVADLIEEKGLRAALPYLLAPRLAIACPAPMAMLGGVAVILARPESVARAFGLGPSRWTIT